MDNFSFFINGLISLCYESANVDCELLNFNLKSIVLNVMQSIMADLNSMSNVLETSAPKKSVLFKKIMMPLIGTSAKSEPSQFNSIFSLPFGLSGSSLLSGLTGINTAPQSITYTTSTSSSMMSTIFDNDFRFQRFIVFIVDFIHTIYDKISDQPIHDTSYDVNDELSIFSFSILTHSLSLGLVILVFFSNGFIL